MHFAVPGAIFELMPVSMEFLRGVLGLIGIACAWMLGRSVALFRRGWLKPRRVYAWAVRTLLCMLAITIKHPVDVADIIVWSLSAAALIAGYAISSRERKEEDLSRTMFPE